MPRRSCKWNFKKNKLIVRVKRAILIYKREKQSCNNKGVNKRNKNVLHCFKNIGKPWLRLLMYKGIRNTPRTSLPKSLKNNFRVVKQNKKPTNKKECYSQQGNLHLPSRSFHCFIDCAVLLRFLSPINYLYCTEQFLTLIWECKIPLFESLLASTPSQRTTFWDLFSL